MSMDKKPSEFRDGTKMNETFYYHLLILDKETTAKNYARECHYDKIIAKVTFNT